MLLQHVSRPGHARGLPHLPMLLPALAHAHALAHAQSHAHCPHQVASLKPGTQYRVRLRTEVDSSTVNAAAAAFSKALGSIQPPLQQSGTDGLQDAAVATLPTPEPKVVCTPSAASTFQTVSTAPSMPQPPSLSSRERKALKVWHWQATWGIGRRHGALACAIRHWAGEQHMTGRT